MHAPHAPTRKVCALVTSLSRVNVVRVVAFKPPHHLCKKLITETSLWMAKSTLASALSISLEDHLFARQQPRFGKASGLRSKGIFNTQQDSALSTCAHHAYVGSHHIMVQPCRLPPCNRTTGSPVIVHPYWLTPCIHGGTNTYLYYPLSFIVSVHQC